MDELILIVQDLLLRVEELENKIQELESQSGETNSTDLNTSFPTDPYPNQIFIRTDEVGAGGGGIIYRYDANVSDWVPITT